jgi:membrane fusion protein, multidrug efflux system
MTLNTFLNTNTSKMNYTRILNSLIAVPVIFLSLYGCSSSGTGTEVTSGEERGESVRIMPLAYSEISRSITRPATLLPFREVHLASASPGRIQKINAEVGDKVSVGQLLVEMDKTQLLQASVQLTSLERDYRRLDTLRKVGSISQQQYDQMKTQYDLALSNVDFLQENTSLAAPFSGVVSGRYFENGEMFSGAPNTPAGKAAILSLVQTSRLRARVNVSEAYLPRISVGMPVRITSDVWPGESFNGTVLHIYPAIDAATRTFTIEVSVPNPGEKLRPGMFARASLEIGRAEVFAVPSLAVLKLQGSNERYVFIEENGRAKRVIVQMGDRFDEMVEIISDQIKPGDNLIIAGQARLLDGVAVSVR